MHLIFLSGMPFDVSSVDHFFPIPVFSLEVNIYSTEMHSHMNVDLCKIF